MTQSANRPADPKVQRLSQEAAGLLSEIVQLFKPGVKATLLIRSPKAPDHSQDFMLTMEFDINDACAALQALQSQPPSEVSG